MALSQVDIKPHGYVQLVRVDGDDDFIAWSARHGKESDNPTPRLIRYMMRHRHTTPFEMVGMVFRVKCPIFVARQWMRHRTGTFNEMSMRYEKAGGEFWLPEGGKWRKQSASNHQGSSEESVKILGMDFNGMSAEDAAFEEYNSRIAQGASREQARSCLLVSAYTEFVWKIDLHNLFHFLKLRLDPHAQAEMREFAQAIEGFVKGEFPIAHVAWVDCVRDAMTLTVQDQRALDGMLRAGSPNVRKHFPNDRECREFVEKMESIGLDMREL